MVAPVVNGVLVDTNDAGNLLGEIVVPVGYLVGDVLPGASTPVAPIVDNVIPASGSSLAPGDSVQFDLTHSSGASALEEIVVMVFSRAWEVAYDLDAASFGPAFGGTRVDITNGYRFTLYRREGWQFLPGSGLEIRVAPRTTDGATSS